MNSCYAESSKLYVRICVRITQGRCPSVVVVAASCDARSSAVSNWSRIFIFSFLAYLINSEVNVSSFVNLV